MTTAAAGIISLAEETLKVTLADLASFRTWVGATTQEQARNRIYHDAPPNPASGKEVYSEAELESLRPLAVVTTTLDGGLRTDADAVDAGGTTFKVSGQLLALFEQDVDPQIDQNPAEIMRRFKNTLGAFIEELHDVSRTGPYLAVNSISLFGPERVAAEKVEAMGDHVWAFLMLEYGQ